MGEAVAVDVGRCEGGQRGQRAFCTCSQSNVQLSVSCGCAALRDTPPSAAVAGAVPPPRRPRSRCRPAVAFSGTAQQQQVLRHTLASRCGASSDVDIAWAHGATPTPAPARSGPRVAVVCEQQQLPPERCCACTCRCRLRLRSDQHQGASSSLESYSVCALRLERARLRRARAHPHVSCARPCAAGLPCCAAGPEGRDGTRCGGRAVVCRRISHLGRGRCRRRRRSAPRAQPASERLSQACRVWPGRQRVRERALQLGRACRPAGRGFAFPPSLAACSFCC
jgi:hypothetical protein